jgi:hypothetical protein
MTFRINFRALIGLLLRFLPTETIFVAEFLSSRKLDIFVPRRNTDKPELRTPSACVLHFSKLDTVVSVQVHKHSSISTLDCRAMNTNQSYHLQPLRPEATARRMPKVLLDQSILLIFRPKFSPVLDATTVMVLPRRCMCWCCTVMQRLALDGMTSTTEFSVSLPNNNYHQYPAVITLEL